LEVDAAGIVVADLGDRNEMHGVVELAVPSYSYRFNRKGH
jgi:hypothetical protein